MTGVKKWIGYGVWLIIIIFFIVAIYSGAMVLQKYIREEKREYDNVEEIIEKYYVGSNTQLLNNGNYFYLVEEKDTSNIEELIRFEDGKYMAFDKVLRNTKGIGADSSTDFNSDIYFTDIIVYEYNGDYIIVIKRKRSQEFVVIYDDYEVWKSKIIGNTIYYFNVRSKDDITYNYKILATVDNKAYEIADKARILVRLLD